MFSEDLSDDANGEGVWSADIEQAFQEACIMYPTCGRRKIIVQDQSEGNHKMFGRNELIARYIHMRTGKTRSRKQVSSHIQVLARRKAKEHHPGYNGREMDGYRPDSNGNSNPNSMSPENDIKGYCSSGSPPFMSSMMGLPSSVPSNGALAQNGNNANTINNHMSALWENVSIATSKIRLVEFCAMIERQAASGVQTNTTSNTPTTPTLSLNNHSYNNCNQNQQNQFNSNHHFSTLNHFQHDNHQIQIHQQQLLQLQQHQQQLQQQQQQQQQPQPYQHLFVHINHHTLSCTNNKLETIDILEFEDKFPCLHSLYRDGPQNAFFLVKFWADINTNDIDERDSFYSFSSQYESNLKMSITCSTKVCSFGQQVVEKVELIELDKFSHAPNYIYRIKRSEMCEYMRVFIQKLSKLPDRKLMNSVLENFTILQIVSNKDTGETLLCTAFVFEVSTSENQGAQHHIYRLTSHDPSNTA